jgi:hypothetical protein
MSDLLYIILIFAVVNNLVGMLFSYLRVAFAKFKTKHHEKMTFSTSIFYYSDGTRKRKLKKSFIHSSIFFAVLCSFVSNSFIDFLISMILIGVQNYYVFKFYMKQSPTYYVTENGVACLLMVPSIDKEQTGFKKWDKVTYFDENASRLYLAGETFDFNILSKDDDGLKKAASEYIKPALKKVN